MNVRQGSPSAQLLKSLPVFAETKARASGATMGILVELLAKQPLAFWTVMVSPTLPLAPAVNVMDRVPVPPVIVPVVMPHV